MKPVRFIHTSDIHLDTSFSASGFPPRLGHRKREAIRATFRRILQEARDLAVDIVLIAGDLFEHDRVTPDTVEFLKQQFESLGAIRIFIAPGNHDPCMRGSPYCEEAWPENVHIFREEEFRSVELRELGLRVTGFGFSRTQVPDHHLVNLPSLPAGNFNIVLAHGSDITSIPEGKSLHGPFTIEEIAGKNVGYCALGHYHQQRRLWNPIDKAEIWYSGIPEGRGWDEEGPCGYLLGNIEDGEVQIESRICNQYPLRTLVIDCDGFSSREQIVEAILQQRGSLFDGRTILRVRLAGSVDPRIELSLEQMEERIAEEVLHVHWEDQTQPALDFETLSRENTLCGRFVRSLNQRIAAAPPEDRDLLERARLYGVQALQGQEVRLR